MVKLTDKQEMFCEEYIADPEMNITNAAIKAGYSKKTAYSIGSENLKKPEIDKRIQELKNERSERLRFTADEVLSKLAILSRSNIKNFAKPDGFGGLTMHIPDGISDEDMYCISELTTEEYKENDGTPVKKTKIKFVDKLRAIEAAGRHVGVQAFKEKVDVEQSINLDISNAELGKKILFALNKSK